MRTTIVMIDQQDNPEEEEGEEDKKRRRFRCFRQKRIKQENERHRDKLLHWNQRDQKSSRIEQCHQSLSKGGDSLSSRVFFFMILSLVSRSHEKGKRQKIKTCIRQRNDDEKGDHNEKRDFDFDSCLETSKGIQHDICVSLFCPVFCDEIPWCAVSSGNQVKSLDLSSHLPTDMISSWQSSSKISSVITVKRGEKESMNVVQHHKYQPVWSRVCCWTCDNCLSRSRQKEKQLIFMIRVRWTKHTCLNDLSQKEHLYGFSPVWIRACCASCVNSILLVNHNVTDKWVTHLMTAIECFTTLLTWMSLHLPFISPGRGWSWWSRTGIHLLEVSLEVPLSQSSPQIRSVIWHQMMR